MNFDEYINRIGFLVCKPHSRPTGFHMLSKLAAKFNIQLDQMNTKLPEKNRDMKQKLSSICKIPKMSTFAIGSIINHGVWCMPNDTCFLNVGVWNGFTLFSGMIGNPQKDCIGIDNFSQFGGPKEQFLQRLKEYKGENHHFYEMNYIDYFKNIHAKPIGFYIYDGDHSYDNQLTGLEIAEPFFSENCIILIDDTNWKDPREATLEFINSSANKYELLLDRTTYGIRHPTFWNGIMLFRRC